MNPSETFNWPDGDVILRSTHGAESRDFRVHKFFLSFTSPVFKDMFAINQPSSSAESDVDIVDLSDPPRALELILRLIYPSPTLPVVNNLAIVSEALTLADKYDIEVARSRLRSSLVQLAKTEPLRVYAIACRLGFEDEMKIASSHTLQINLPALTQLPDEFKFIPATEYHRLIHLHARYRKEAMDIAINSLQNTSLFGSAGGGFGTTGSAFGNGAFGTTGGGRTNSTTTTVTTRTVIKTSIVDVIMKGTPLDYRSLTLALKADHGIDVEADHIGNDVRGIIGRINALNLTV